MVRHVEINDNGEYGVFFVREYEPRQSDNLPVYSATWACYSSYGTYGHYWASMGCPFGKFIKQIDLSYLLGKIAKQDHFDLDLYSSQMINRIKECAKEKNLSAAKCDEILLTFDGLCGDYGHSRDVLSFVCFDDQDISELIGDFEGINGLVYDNQATLFVEKLWPRFVKEYDYVESAH